MFLDLKVAIWHHKTWFDWLMKCQSLRELLISRDTTGENAVGIKMKRSVSLSSDLWRWSTYFGWNIPTEIRRSIFDKPVPLRGKGIKSGKSHSYWLARFNRKMSFHFLGFSHVFLTGRFGIMVGVESDPCLAWSQCCVAWGEEEEELPQKWVSMNAFKMSLLTRLDSFQQPSRLYDIIHWTGSNRFQSFKKLTIIC